MIFMSHVELCQECSFLYRSLALILVEIWTILGYLRDIAGCKIEVDEDDGDDDEDEDEDDEDEDDCDDEDEDDYDDT